jgi:hypothetical protein
MDAPSALYQIILSDAARALHDERVLLDPSSVSSVDLTAFVSCYNEAPLIEQTLEDIRIALRESGISFEIIVIDDCSKDDSSEKVTDTSINIPRTVSSCDVIWSTRGSPRISSMVRFLAKAVLQIILR